MKQKLILFVIIFSFSLYALTIEVDSANAAKTGSYNFCTQFPAFPECVGWRTEAISDNYWFCEYVDLDELCKNSAIPEKKIEPKNQNDCCQYIGAKLEKSQLINIKQEQQVHDSTNLKEDLDSVLPLIIWTDKDHYNFRDKAVVYGKFDFTNPSIIQNIKGEIFAQTGKVTKETFTIDIKLNNKNILRDIPVSSSGWFSAFFHHNNVYNFSTQNNLLGVEYIITQKQVPLGGPKTQATYEFTTGDISKTDESFDIWIDDSNLPNKIQFGIVTENNERFIEHTRHNLVITRLTTPDGFVIPIESNYSIKDLSKEYSEFSKYGSGTYEIQVTYGNNTAQANFEY